MPWGKIVVLQNNKFRTRLINSLPAHSGSPPGSNFIQMKNVALIAALALGSVACGKKEKEAEEKKFCLDESFKARIELFTAELQTVTEGIHLTGSVEANPDKVVSYIPLVSGVVTSTFFSLGDKVVKGQVLAEMRSTELSGMSASLTTLDSRIRAAQSKLSSVQSMFDDGITSRKELADAVSELEVLKAEKSRTERDMSLYSGNSGKGVFQIKAPATGIITEKNVNPGEQISGGGEALFTISDLNNLWVMVNIYASNVNNIHQGMDVNITTLSYPDDIFKGNISQISPVFDEDARVLKGRVILPNGDFRLKPGMLTDVTAWKKTGRQAVGIPASAVVFSDNQYYVLVYKDDCHIEVRKITIAAKNEDTAFISEGLQPGEQIIAKNQLLIFESL